MPMMSTYKPHRHDLGCWLGWCPEAIERKREAKRRSRPPRPARRGRTIRTGPC